MSDLTAVQCIDCGLQFGVDSGVHAIWLKEKKKAFYCPNGHALTFVGSSDKDKELTNLRKKVGDLEKKTEELVLKLEAATGVIRREKARADDLQVTVDLIRSEREIHPQEAKLTVVVEGEGDRR